MTGFFGPWDLGRLISDTFGIYRRHWLLFIAIVAPFIVVIDIISWRLTLSIDNWSSLPDLYNSSSLAFTALFVIMGYLLLDMLIAMVIETMMNCSFIHTIGQQYTTRKVSMGRAFSSAVKRVLTAIMAVLLRGVVIAALTMTVIGIPFAIYFYIKWLFVTHSILFEGKNVPESLSKSGELVNNNWWRILGYIIVIALIAVLIAIPLTFIDMLLPAYTSYNITATVASVLITPITIVATTLLYFTLRVEKEGYHIGRLAADMQAWDADKKPYYAPDPVVRSSYCSRCGQQLAPQTRFCPNCGKQVDDNSSTTKAPDSEESSGNGPEAE